MENRKFPEFGNQVSLQELLYSLNLDICTLEAVVVKFYLTTTAKDINSKFKTFRILTYFLQRRIWININK